VRPVIVTNNSYNAYIRPLSSRTRRFNASTKACPWMWSWASSIHRPSSCHLFPPFSKRTFRKFPVYFLSFHTSSPVQASTYHYSVLRIDKTVFTFLQIWILRQCYSVIGKSTLQISLANIQVRPIRVFSLFPELQATLRTLLAYLSCNDVSLYVIVSVPSTQAYADFILHVWPHAAFILFRLMSLRPFRT
jgi:hypothetical protein